MSGELASELRRAYTGRMFAVCLLIGVTLALLQVWGEVIPATQYLNQVTLYPTLYPQSVFAWWMGGGAGSGMFKMLYYFVAMVLAALPHAASFKEDLDSGYAAQALTRTDRSTYLVAKLASVFLSAGVVATVPLLVNLMASMVFLPALVPQSSTFLFPLFAGSLLGDLYYVHPFLYTLVYLGLDFVFMGLSATLGLLVSHVCRTALTAALTPLGFFLGMYALGTAVRDYRFVPVTFLRIDQPFTGVSPLVILGEMGALLLACLVFWSVGMRKEYL